MNFSEITRTLTALGAIAGKNDKMAFLKAHDDEDIKEVYQWLYDGTRISGIAEKKWNKYHCCKIEGWNPTLHDVFEYLDKNHTGSDENVTVVKFAGTVICSSKEEEELYGKIICKNLPLGVDAKTINKVFPGLVPTFDVCLCEKYYDKPELVDGTREFAISTKVDGCRCIAMIEDGNVKLVSRQGKMWEGLVEVEEELRNSGFNNFVFDGELTIDDFMKYPSKDVYKMTTKLISTKDPEKRGVTLNVFDGMPLDEWKKQKCSQAYSERAFFLKSMLPEGSHVKYLGDIYVGKDVSKIEEYMKGIVRKEDWEGLVIKFTDSKYEWKRSKNWLKVKAFDEMDLIVKRVEEGTNKNQNTLGALVCEIDHPKFGHIEAKVGSGYSDEERDRFWGMNLIGRVISVQYFEVTENTSTHVKSLRFPVFLELKEEGQEPNN